MTGEQLGTTAGVILGLVFEYLPGLAKWYQAQEDNVQRLILLGAMLLVTLTIFGMGCAGLSDTFACTKEGAYQAIKVFVSGIISSQATYLVMPRKS